MDMQELQDKIFKEIRKIATAEDQTEEIMNLVNEYMQTQLAFLGTEYDAGYADGYTDGYNNGYNDGTDDAKELGNG